LLLLLLTPPRTPLWIDTREIPELNSMLHDWLADWLALSQDIRLSQNSLNPGATKEAWIIFLVGVRKENQDPSTLRRMLLPGEKTSWVWRNCRVLGTVISREDRKQAIPTRHRTPKSYRDCKTKSFFREHHQALTLTLKLRPLSTLFARTRLLL
jgi:hypothetical protein